MFGSWPAQHDGKRKVPNESWDEIRILPRFVDPWAHFTGESPDFFVVTERPGAFGQL